MIVADLLENVEKTAEIGDERLTEQSKRKKKIASRSLCVFVGFSVLMLVGGCILGEPPQQWWWTQNARKVTGFCTTVTSLRLRKGLMAQACNRREIEIGLRNLQMPGGHLPLCLGIAALFSYVDFLLSIA